jgi:hypothetical protein
MEFADGEAETPAEQTSAGPEERGLAPYSVPVPVLHAFRCPRPSCPRSSLRISTRFRRSTEKVAQRQQILVYYILPLFILRQNAVSPSSADADEVQGPDPGSGSKMQREHFTELR